jgi:DNA-binding transcriptional LysR family regulator
VNCSVVETIAGGLELIARGDADLFFYTLARPPTSAVSCEIIRPTPTALYGGRRYWGLKDATPERIAELPFVLPVQGTEAETLVLGALAKMGVFPTKTALRAQYSDVVRDLVVEGCGVGLLFEAAAAGALDRGDLFAFSLKSPPMLQAVFRRRRDAGAAVASVEGSLLETLRAA